jgi:hypothetical protein
MAALLALPTYPRWIGGMITSRPSTVHQIAHSDDRDHSFRRIATTYSD